MTRLGAEPDALDTAAGALRRSSAQMSEVERSLRQLLRSTRWEGPDRRMFDSRFGELSGGLNRAGRFLADLSTELARQAAEQRRTSEGWSGTGAGGAPLRAAAPDHQGTEEGSVPPAALPPGVLDGLRTAHGPADVARRWDRLTPGQRATVIAGHPDVIANRDGIAPADRIAANHRRIERDARTATGDRKALLESWLADTTDPVTHRHGPSRVLLYDPAAGQVAVVYGDIATARDVIVAVPGTGTTVDSYQGGADVGGEARRARDLYDAAHRKGRDRDVAVVGWLGYDAPDWSLANNPGLAGPGQAGGRRLADLTRGLGLDDDQRLGIVGHSYGALVVGEALRDGAQADNVVFLGAPGTGVDRAADLRQRRGTDVFAMRAPGDPVGGLERFGTSPTDPDFGATRLAASNNGMLFSHSEYWSGPNLDQLAGAMTDTQVETQSGATPGEWAGDVLGGGFGAGDDAIDLVQDHTPLPESWDHAIDVAQRPLRTAVGGVKTAVSQTVDDGVEVARQGWHRATDWLTR